MRFDDFGLGVFVFAVFAVFMLDMLVFGVFVHEVLGVAQSGSVFGAFVRGIGFEFGAVGSAVLFNFLGFLFGEFGFRGGLIFGCVEVRSLLALFFFGFFVLGKFGFADKVNPFDLIFFKFGATDECIGFRFIGSLLVFGFGQFECERRSLLIV